MSPSKVRRGQQAGKTEPFGDHLVLDAHHVPNRAVWKLRPGRPVDFDKARKLGPEVPSRIAMHRLQPEAFPDRGALLGEAEDALRLAERSCSLSEP
jgi:hypothetical protein